MNLEEIILLSDIVKLPKETLKDICINLDVPDTGSIGELAERVWNKAKEGQQQKSIVFETCKDRIFCGRTSSMWYYSTSEGIRGVKELLSQGTNGSNPFEHMRIPDRESLTSDPVLICAAEGEEEGEYLLRYTYKTGVTREVFVDSVSTHARSAVTTVRVNEEQGYIEIRTEPKAADRIAKTFAQAIRQQVTIGVKPIMSRFGYNIEEIADALGGELVDAVGKPQIYLDEFTQNHATSVIRILAALDSYFESEDIEELQQRLNEARELLGDEYAAVPFTVLILNGMEKVGLGVKDRDLRGLPLYDYLKTNLEHQGGYVQFSVNEGGVEHQYTVKIGLKTNSIYFITPATEQAMTYVRERLVLD
ncbi:hypothetical protein AAC03nite_26330 [Alicyclobacillus acidoterrestris]|nr:hypothetical protein AAC03nite_26330 [Alicyclobacillus acidoterrestris]